MEYFNIFVIIISLLLSAFFSGSEIAFVSANKLYFELQKKQGVYSGKIIAKFTSNPSQLIATLLVGNTLTLVIYGIYMAQIIEPWLEQELPTFLKNDVSLLIFQTLLSTIIVLVTAEFLPKTTFLLNPDRMLELLAIPINIAYWLLSPFVYVIVGLSKFLIINVLSLNYSEDKPAFRLVDLSNYIHNTIKSGTNEDHPEIDTKIFTNALLFKEVRVRDCFVPRTEIVSVALEDDIDTLRKAFVDSGHSKILVYQESIDNIVGYCHCLRLFQNPQSIEEILSEVMVVPETALARELLVKFINEHKSIALVVDEFGGTSGVVTLEDVMEEIFGEIQDEYDQENWTETQLDEYTFLLSARHEIDYLNEKYQWQLPEGDYDTLGGLIFYINENIPKVGDIIVQSPFTFRIESMQYSRVDQVKLMIDRKYLDKLPKEA